MKKLLIATMAAVSVGLCVKAEDTGFISGTSFEDIEPGTELPNGSGNFNWPSEADDALFVVSNLTAFADEEKGSRPDYWATAADRVALTIDTSTPLCCDVSSNNTAYQLSNGDLFFDSVVQFTATDVIAESDSRDKLRVWLYSSSDDVSTETPGSFGETSPKTCLVVTAGYLKDGATPSVTNYLANIDVAPDTWHRLTIKSFKDGGYVKYNVWVDGTQISVDGVNDFMSLIPETQTPGYYSVQCVAFDGKGAVDDIVFTTKDPFAVPSYKITVNIDDVDQWTSGSSKQYSIDGTQYLDFNAGDVLAIPETASKIWFKIAMPGDVKLEGVDNSAGEDGNGGYYWIKEVNVADIISNGEGEVVLKVVDNTGTPVVTTYAVTVNSANATVVGLAEKYAADAAVTFAVTANEDYKVVSVMMNSTILSANAEGRYSFIMPAEAVTITVTTQEIEEDVTYPSVGGVETPEYSVNAKAAIDAAFPENSYPTDGLTVTVNGEVLAGAKAVEMLNEAVEMFTLADDAKFFNEHGVMEISFKATSADPETIAYEATVGKATATVNDTSYEVVSKYIDIATNTELTDKPEGTVTFRLVIQKK